MQILKSFEKENKRQKKTIWKLISDSFSGFKSRY